MQFLNVKLNNYIFFSTIKPTLAKHLKIVLFNSVMISQHFGHQLVALLTRVSRLLGIFQS
jgi:hypothetical protein